MLFSSISFLYYFLPILLVVYFLTPRKGKNIVLLLASLLFYFWGEPSYTILLVASVLSGYVHGLLIDRFRGTKWSKAALISAIVISVGLLVVFKYADFIIDTLNGVLNAKIPLLKLALPIGISFYTFQLLSYIIDLYRGQTKVQRSFIKLATYVALFPQLIAGPIVRYSTVAQELDSRTHSLSSFSKGSVRFILGLSKKVLLANTMGELCEIFKASNDKSVLFFWMYAIAFALHIYFDFSGYSDMAIGLGRIFGFTFLENFNYPYISKTITEFWRRWHISLGAWFRDYVYIPLGGNRTSKTRWIFNILIVWMLTGLWHGAGWPFVIWGLFFAVLLIAEKLFLGKLLSKVPAAVSRLYTILMILASFVLFNSSTLSEAVCNIGGMFGLGAYPAIGNDALYYLRSYAVLLIVGVIGCTPLPKMLINKISKSRAGSSVISVITPIALAALLLVCTAYLVDGSFNPFIYFRF